MPPRIIKKEPQLCADISSLSECLPVPSLSAPQIRLRPCRPRKRLVDCIAEWRERQKALAFGVCDPMETLWTLVFRTPLLTKNRRPELIDRELSAESMSRMPLKNTTNSVLVFSSESSLPKEAPRRKRRIIPKKVAAAATLHPSSSPASPPSCMSSPRNAIGNGNGNGSSSSRGVLLNGRSESDVEFSGSMTSSGVLVLYRMHHSYTVTPGMYMRSCFLRPKFDPVERRHFAMVLYPLKAVKRCLQMCASEDQEQTCIIRCLVDATASVKFVAQQWGCQCPAYSIADIQFTHLLTLTPLPHPDKIFPALTAATTTTATSKASSAAAAASHPQTTDTGTTTTPATDSSAEGQQPAASDTADGDSDPAVCKIVSRSTYESIPPVAEECSPTQPHCGPDRDRDRTPSDERRPAVSTSAELKSPSTLPAEVTGPLLQEIASWRVDAAARDHSAGGGGGGGCRAGGGGGLCVRVSGLIDQDDCPPPPSCPSVTVSPDAATPCPTAKTISPLRDISNEETTAATNGYAYTYDEKPRSDSTLSNSTTRVPSGVISASAGHVMEGARCHSDPSAEALSLSLPQSTVCKSDTLVTRKTVYSSRYAASGGVMSKLTASSGRREIRSGVI
ncbi:unnamed protein product [Vitrella brassicaformis CCMP3155]|uniref:Uncharacterized protein n=1 Tax=Vitrella brassicaformis (strain CCMP3155) TaxID=1169540 RepID=A0A0G4FYV8_VITBC|nr:unnamed protein product [Vitrella brassicaformis CCMP3155]|eukprot:CEM20267.1 unnamed protein product [Vitrella brassicaformis CCMP3155]